MADGSGKRPETITLRCPYCDRKLVAPVTLAGKYAQCPKCPNRVLVPQLSASPGLSPNAGDSRDGENSNDNLDRHRRRRFCPDCGNRLLPKEGSCRECARARATTRPSKCPGCDRNIDTGVVICPRCHFDRATGAPAVRGTVRPAKSAPGAATNWTVTCRDCRAVSYFEHRREPPNGCPQCAGANVDAIPQSQGEQQPPSESREVIPLDDTEEGVPETQEGELRCYDCRDFVQPVSSCDYQGLTCPLCQSQITQAVGSREVDRFLACESLVTRADQLMSEGKVEEALSFYQKADKLHEGHPQAMIGLGRALAMTATATKNRGQFESGLQMLEEALRRYPQLLPALEHLQSGRAQYQSLFARDYEITAHSYSLQCQALNDATAASLRQTLYSTVDQMLRKLGQQRGALSEAECEIARRELQEIHHSLGETNYRLDMVSYLPTRWLDSRLRQLCYPAISLFPLLESGQLRFSNAAAVRALDDGGKTMDELSSTTSDPLMVYPFVLAARARKLSLSNADVLATFQGTSPAAEQTGNVSLSLVKQHQQDLSCWLSFRCHAGPNATRIAAGKPPGLRGEDIYLAVLVQRLSLVLMWVLYGRRSMETMGKSQLDYLSLQRQLQGRWISKPISRQIDMRQLESQFARLGAKRQDGPQGWLVWQLSRFSGLRRLLGRRPVIAIERLAAGHLDTNALLAACGLPPATRWPAEHPLPHLIIGQVDGITLARLCEFLGYRIVAAPDWHPVERPDQSAFVSWPDMPPPIALLGANAVTHSFDQGLLTSLEWAPLEVVDDIIVAAGRALPLIDPEWTRIWLAMKHVLAHA